MQLRIGFLLGVMSLYAISSSSFASDPLTLDECISLALEGNLGIGQSEVALENAEVGIVSARSAYYPSLSLSSSYRNEEGFGDGRQGRYSTSVGLQYQIFRGGYVGAGVGIARANAEAARANYRRTADEVVLAVKQAFFTILQKQDQVLLAENVLERRKEDLVIISLRYDAGRESAPAVQESEANLLQAEYDKMRAEEELALATMELNLVIGRDRKAEIAVEYEDEPVTFPSVDTVIEWAGAERPEIQAERARRVSIEAQIDQAKSTYWPTVSLSSSYGWQGETLLDQEGGWSAGISLSLPIFDGFARRARVTQANLSLREEDLRLAELENVIEEEVEEAYSTWDLATKNLEVSETSLSAAQEMYELTRLQYEQGLTSYLFLQQKESSLTQSEYNRANALFNLRLSAARLEKAWGRRDW